MAQYGATAKPDLDAVTQQLDLSLASQTAGFQQDLTRLTQATLGYLAAHQGFIARAQKQFDLALTDLAALPFTANLTIVYYLAALSHFELGQAEASLRLLKQAIQYATDHNSHYLLANCYYLLAQLANQTSTLEQERPDYAHASQQASFLASLFHEPLHRPTTPPTAYN